MKYLLYVLSYSFLLVGISLTAMADDEPVLQLKKKSPEKKTAASQVKNQKISKLKLQEDIKPPPETKQDQKKSTTDLDRQLLEDLTGKKKEDEPKDKQRLKQLIKRMEQAEEEISKKKTGNKTQQLQQNVVDDLEWLIQLVSEQNRMQKTKKESQKNSTSGQQPKPSETKASQTPKSAPDKKGTNKKDQTGDSDNSLRTAKNKKPAVIGKSVLEKDVWGHLPPTLRKKLLNIYSEKYLPQYDDEVRRYFESLAEEGRKGSRDK